MEIFANTFVTSANEFVEAINVSEVKVFGSLI